MRSRTFAGALVLAAWACLLGRGDAAPPAPSPDWTRLSGLSPERALVRTLDDGPWLGVNDLARLLGATKYWRADLRKLELRAAGHRIQLTAGNPFAIVDDATVWLSAPPRSVRGELHVPLDFLARIPRDSTLAQLVHDRRRGVVLQVPPAGLVESPQIRAGAAQTRVTFPVDRPQEVVVASRSRAHFQVRLDGFFIGGLPDSLPEGSLVRSIRAIPTAGGCAFEFQVAPASAGFAIEAGRGGGVTIAFGSEAGPGLEAFAPEDPPGPRPLRVIVLDPGHGGDDGGVSVEGAVEKTLALDLARRVQTELRRRVGARVLLTREDDRTLEAAARAEFANRAGADLVVSLHFDGGPGNRARGTTAYCPPATFAPAGGRAGEGDPIEIVPWRDVAMRHAVRSRAFADGLLAMIELRAQGPARLRERLPYPMLGVNAPGVMIECATLTSERDRGRITTTGGMAALAETIADAIAAYGREE